MKRIAVFLMGIAFILGGCVSPMTLTEVNNATYEALPANYEEQIKEYISLSLKDPDSAKYKFYKPRKSYTAATRHFAYIVPVDVNAKNSYGGYVGYKTYYIAFINNSYKDVTTGVKYEAVKWSDEVTS